MTRQVHSDLPEEVLISRQAIAARVSELAAAISSDYAGRELFAAIILQGGFIFAADLLRCVDPGIHVRLNFMALSSYGDDTVSSGDVRIVKGLKNSVRETDVLIIDDILDTGRTMSCVRELLKERQAGSIRVATLLLKQRPRTDTFVPDYVGFRIPNVFVVGYGLDHAGRHRNLPDIRVLDAAPFTASSWAGTAPQTVHE